MQRFPSFFAALLTFSAAACTGSSFSGASRSERPSADALAEKINPTGTNSGSSTSTNSDQGVDQNNNGLPTVYIPVGGSKGTGGTSCTSTNSSIAACNNGTIDGVKVGNTIVYVPNTPGSVTSTNNASWPGSPGSGSGGDGAGGGAGSGAGGSGADGAPPGTHAVNVIVYNPQDPPPGVDSGTGSLPGGTNAVGPGLGGITGVLPVGTLGTSSGVITSQPNPNTITITADKLFHIGDGAFQDSSCLGLLNTYPTVGTVYWFPFAVTQANTNVNFTINTLCGVDYSDTDFLIVVPLVPGQGPNYSNHTLLTAGQTTATFAATGLAPGNYALAVKSTKGSSMATDINDHDDFVVGNLTITATAPILPGQVTATDDDDCKSVVDPTQTTPPCTSGTNAALLSGTTPNSTTDTPATGTSTSNSLFGLPLP